MTPSPSPSPIPIEHCLSSEHAFTWMASLSWPIAIIVIAWTFRADLRKLLEGFSKQLDRVSSAKYGDLELKLEREISDLKSKIIEQEALVQDNAKQVATVESLSRVLAAAPSANRATANALNPDFPAKSPGTENNDPWRGQFGGLAVRDSRSLSAVVEPILSRPDWFRVILRVDSTDRGKRPLTGLVRFFVHDTFPQQIIDVPVNREGFAEIQLSAWGAFTVGALADGGQTELELDLASPELPFPEEFKKR